jgi:CheY-like chemotaxis protein
MALASTHAGKRRKRSILVVGNTTGEVGFVTLLLRRFAYDIIDASTAGEAIERISAAVPALVITEQVLPGMSGMDLFHLLRQTKRTASIPVVFVIPLTDAASERRCLDAGAAGCITKPVRAEELYRTVQAVIEPAQRCDIRIDTRLSVSVNNVPLDCDSGGCEIELSERGMYVPMDKPYPRNRRITVQFHINDRAISAEGTVLYSHASGVVPNKESGMGLKFINIEPGDREFIRKFIRDEVTRDIRSSLSHETSDPWQ